MFPGDLLKVNRIFLALTCSQAGVLVFLSVNIQSGFWSGNMSVLEYPQVNPPQDQSSDPLRERRGKHFVYSRVTGASPKWHRHSGWEVGLFWLACSQALYKRTSLLLFHGSCLLPDLISLSCPFFKTPLHFSHLIFPPSLGRLFSGWSWEDIGFYLNLPNSKHTSSL